MNAIGETLRTAIERSDKSLYQIAKESGLSAILVTRFLRGDSDIRLSTAEKLATALNLRVSPPARRRSNRR